MKYQKIINLLGKTIDTTKLPKYTTRKLFEIFDQSSGVYSQNKDIRFETLRLRSDLCDFNDAYIVVTGKVTTTNTGDDDNVYNRKLALKNSAPFFSCILKTNNQLIEDAQDLDTVMPMYNLLYFSKNCRKTTRSFWNYYPDMSHAEYNNNNRDRIFYPIKGSESFDYKTKLVGNLPDGEDELENIKIVAPLKHLSRFIFSLDTLLINSETELISNWSQNCVLTEKATKAAIQAGDDPAAEPQVNAINAPSDLKFSVTDCKIHIPVVTLEAEYENKLYEELKTGITVAVIWNKYRPQIINQPATNNLNYLIDPTFNNVNILFVLDFENEKDRSNFSKYYTPTVEIKDYNVIIDGQQPFYKIPIKNKEETYKAITELIKNDDFTTGNCLNY